MKFIQKNEPLFGNFGTDLNLWKNRYFAYSERIKNFLVSKVNTKVFKYKIVF